MEPVQIPGVNHVRVVPAIYRDQDRVAVLNLEGDQVIPRGTQVGEVIPMKLSKQTKEAKEGVRSAKEAADTEEQLIRDLRIDENDLLKANPAIREKLKALVREYTDIFSSPEQNIGKTDLIEFEINLEPGTRPVKQKTRPLNPKQKESF